MALFKADVPATANTEVFAPVVKTSVTLALCNRTAQVIPVRVALAATVNPSNAEYIEYDCPIEPNGVLERSMVVDANEKLVIYTGAAGISAVGFGFGEVA